MYRLTPKEEISARIAALKKGLAEAGIDTALIVQNPDLFYFTGSIQQGVLAVPASGEPVYFVRRVYERAVAESGIDRIERINGLKDIPSYFRGRGLPLGTVGLELDVMPVAVYERYARLLEEAKAAEDISPIVREIRSVKGPSEIEALSACGRNLAELISGARRLIRPGMTETELSGILHGRSIAGGHTTINRMRAWNQDPGLGCVISGPDAAIPSYADFPTAGRGSCPYVPAGHGRRAFRADEPVIVDLMWAQDGYLVDMARTFVAGALPEKLSMAHEMAVKVMRNIESAIRPGAVAGDLYEIGAEMASHSPFGGHFMGPPGYNVRFIGHGVGIEVDEIPFIAKGMKTTLKAGMTFALEPKFVFPGEGAVGLENTYLVTDAGFAKLTPLEESVIRCPASGGAEGA